MLELFSRIALAGWLLATVLLSVASNLSLPHPGGSDKLAHFLAYALHGALCPLAFSPGRGLATALLAIAGLGVALEGVQSLLPARQPSAADLAANLAGVACGAALGWSLRRRLRAPAS